MFNIRVGDLMSDNNGQVDIINAFKPLLEFLVATFGLQKSVLYEIDPQTGTSRAVLSKLPKVRLGDELGPIGKQVVINSKKGYHYLINADNNEETDAQEKISYFMIRNAESEVIGVLMIVLEIGHLITLKRSLDLMLGFTPIDNRPVEFNDLYHELETENFSLTKHVSEIVNSVISEHEIPIQRMTMEEKAQILYKLDEMEIFNLKGAVKEVTAQLMISQATLYRLLRRTD